MSRKFNLYVSRFLFIWIDSCAPIIIRSNESTFHVLCRDEISFNKSPKVNEDLAKWQSEILSKVVRKLSLEVPKASLVSLPWQNTRKKLPAVNISKNEQSWVKFLAFETLKISIIAQCLAGSAEMDVARQCETGKSPRYVFRYFGSSKDLIRDSWVRPECRRLSLFPSNWKLAVEQFEGSSRRFRRGTPGWTSLVFHLTVSEMNIWTL